MTLIILRTIFCLPPLRQLLSWIVRANAPTMPGG